MPWIRNRKYFSTTPCPACEGKRLNKNALSVTIDEKNIWEVTTLTIEQAFLFFKELEKKLSSKEREIAEIVLNEIKNRLQFMLDVGLNYIGLNRQAGTLSGGESQRIRLASQVGTKLVGALYVLDEPTIGLHQKDNERLIRTLRNLCDIGNSIIIVEHDEDTILKSDWVVDFGPKAGVQGGEIVFSGPLNNLLLKENNKTMYDCNVLGSAKNSLTGQYLRREKIIEKPAHRRGIQDNTLKLKVQKAYEHNLKNLSD